MACTFSALLAPAMQTWATTLTRSLFRGSSTPSKTEVDDRFCFVYTLTVRQVQPAEFGSDHWRLLVYVFTLCSFSKDSVGRPNHDRMRCNHALHPGLGGLLNSRVVWRPSFGTRLNVETLPEHDDWHCIDDFVAAGYVELLGTGIHPAFKLTAEGRRQAEALHRHVEKGGRYASYSPVDCATV